MDIGKAFGYVFEDESWITKVLIGGLIIWIPIVNFAVFGFMLKVAENVARGNPRVLPEWSDFGDLFMRGLYFFLIGLVYQIPVYVLACVVGGLAGGLGSTINPDTGEGAGPLAAVLLCLYPLIFILTLVLAAFTYAAVARYVATNTLSEAFKFGEVFNSVRANLGTWVIFLLVILLAGLVGSLGMIACGIGLLFTLFYAYLVMGHALGQTVQRIGLVTTSGFVTDPIPPYNPPTTYQ